MLVAIEDLMNSSCFANQTGTFFFIDKQKPFILLVYSGNRTLWQYGSNQSRSSLIIFAGSLRSNQTYQFKVNLTNIQNSSIVFTGDLLVQIQDNTSAIIAIM